MSETQQQNDTAWLSAHLHEWVTAGLITEAQARAIEARYREQRAPARIESPPWSVFLFVALGAVVMGVGALLLIAYNWHVLSKSAKLAIIFGALGGAHAGGILMTERGGRWRVAGEGLCLLGTMLYGAGIWLIAQVYHVQQHYPHGFLLWSLGGLALGWAMPSVAHGMLASVLLCVWVCSEAWGFRVAYTWAPLVIAALPGLLAWRERSRVLLGVVIIAVLVSLLAIADTLGGHIWLLLLTTGAGLIGIGHLVRRVPQFASSASVWEGIGWVVFVFVSYLYSFPAFRPGLFTHGTMGSVIPASLAFGWLPFGLSLAVWAVVISRLWWGRDAHGDTCRAECWLVPAGVIACTVMTWYGGRSLGMLRASVCNVLLLGLALAWMTRGARQARSGAALSGAGLVAALAVARYFDFFESLAVRGAVFVLVGTLLFAEGLVFVRARRARQTVTRA